MKANEIRKDVLEYIASDIQRTVARLGINTSITFSLDRKDRLEMLSTPFQTMPMIFKLVYLKGYAWTEEREGCTDLTIRIDYNYKHWHGGSNGCDLGVMRYVIDEAIPSADKFTDNPLRRYDMYIHKVQGIEI